MPLRVKGILPNGFFIGKIKGLLKNKSTDHGVKFFGRSPKGFIKVFGNLMDWYRWQDMFPE